MYVHYGNGPCHWDNYDCTSTDCGGDYCHSGIVLVAKVRRDNPIAAKYRIIMLVCAMERCIPEVYARSVKFLAIA